MSFISVEFVILFVVTFLAYYLVKKPVYKKIILLLGSSLFIGYYHISFLLVALSIILLTYCLGFKIARARQDKNIGWLYFSSIFLLGFIWFVFRYPDVLENTVNYLLSTLNIHSHIPEHSLLVPLGISFYTFQAISYFTEIYWEEIKPENNFLNFSIYMLFFMKFLSGPIERPDDFLIQVREEKKFDYSLVSYGLKLFFFGLMKKVLISDNLAVGISDIFSSMNDYTGIQLITTMLIYPIQLYADFSGYTDMALGGAMMFGYRLTNNFDRPFISKTTTELWRRWHISLSSWVRDYIYLPLTSSFRSLGKFGISLSLFIAFVAIGIWHGSSWNFVVYGLIQAIIVIYEMNTANFHNRMLAIPVISRIYKVYSIIITYLLFAISLIFFRSETLSDSIYYITHLSFSNIESVKSFRIGLSDRVYIITGISTILLFVYECFNSKKDLIKSLGDLHVVIRWTIYIVFISIVISLGYFSDDSFVYAMF